MPSVYYNEIEAFAVEWLNNLMQAGELPAGRVDERSIKSVNAADLAGHGQCHFFAGIGGWPYALALAGWPDDAPVWTGSCPCQPFSQAGKRKGTDDARHLWPDFFRLIAECRPATVFGEQVAGRDGLRWLDGVFADLEGIGYACAAADLPAASVASPQRRQRLFWVADAGGAGLAGRQIESARQEFETTQRSGDARGLGLTAGIAGDGGSDEPQRESEGRTIDWRDYQVVGCREGKARRVSAQPGDEPLAYGIPRDVGQRIPEVRPVVGGARSNRVGRLRGYGNAIVPQVAARFVRAFMESV